MREWAERSRREKRLPLGIVISLFQYIKWIAFQVWIALNGARYLNDPREHSEVALTWVRSESEVSPKWAWSEPKVSPSIHWTFYDCYASTKKCFDL